MTQVGDLLRLQELDGELATLSAQIKAIDDRLAGSEEVEAARAAEVQRRAELAALEREQRQVEGAVEDLTAKIVPDETRLYDGSVRSPKELRAIQQEVEHLKERRASLEEQLLGTLDRVEILRADLGRATNELSSLEERWRAETAHLRADRELHAGRLAELEGWREEARALVPRASLVLYDSLLRRKGGIAVVSFRGGTCTGCRVLLPDAVRRRATTSPVPVQCPNCERILAVAG